MPKSTKATTARVERDFTNHPPTPDVQAAMEALRKRYKAVAVELHGMPTSRETALAITNLEQSLMWAMASMARSSYDAQMED